MPLLKRSDYALLFFLLGVVYFTGLFVPLMDNDAAHHGNIALHMYLTGDYVNLIDNGTDYLDKPHLHFWLCAMSYEIFGVTSFAYKLPSFLFSILGIYSVFRLGKKLYDVDVAKLAALIMASSFAFILSLSDVRMDAILVASIALACWQLVELIHSPKFLHFVGAALGLALGFSCKGMVGVFVPLLALFLYLLYKKEWKNIFSSKWIGVVALALLFCFPVLYCYYLQFNLHPEKIVRGRDHINGIKFILFGQSLERYSGAMDKASRIKPGFFPSTFFWAFAPWSLLVYYALGKRLKRISRRQYEWLTHGTFIIFLLVISFAGSRLPQYLNILFPFAAIIAASFISENRSNKKLGVYLWSSALVLIMIAIIINGWMFPVNDLRVFIAAAALAFVIFFYLRNGIHEAFHRSVLAPVAASIFLFFLLNNSFYTQLLRYQAGKPMADMIKGKVDPQEIYFWKNTYSSSFNFYTASLRRPFADSLLNKENVVWLMYDISEEPAILASGYQPGMKYEAKDFEVTKLDLPFLDPRKRESRCSRQVLAQVKRVVLNAYRSN